MGGVLEQACSSPSGSIRRRNTAASDAGASEASTPRRSSPGTPSSAEGISLARSRGFSMASAQSSASKSSQQARATTVQLADECTQLEAQRERERERGAGLAQRLDILRARSKQLEANLQRSREDASERPQKLEETAHHNAHRIQMLMELAALPDEDVSKSALLLGKKAQMENSSSGQELLAGVVHLWQDGDRQEGASSSKAQLMNHSNEGKSLMSARQSGSQSARVANASSAEQLRPVDDLRAQSQSMPSWSAPPPNGSPPSGSGPGRPRSRGASRGVVTQRSAAPPPARSRNGAR